MLYFSRNDSLELITDVVTSVINSHCVCVPIIMHIVCSFAELRGVHELRQEMDEQSKEHLREMNLLKTELLSKLCV